MAEERLPPMRKVSGAAIALVFLGLIAFIVGLQQDPVRAWGGLLVGDFYFLSIALGALFFLAMNYLLRAGWWVALQRIPEALSQSLPWLALLMGVTFLGRHQLYHWSHSEAGHHDEVLAAKSGFLNTPFFYTRMAIVLLLWVALALIMRRISIRQEGSSSPGAFSQLVRCAAVFLPVFALSFSVASFDWLMSLEPHWFSTMFAVYSFAGLFVGALAAITVTAILLSRHPAWAKILRPDHLHDLGKLLFAFSCFWAYTWVSQYLLIWYANIPEETAYYLTRAQGGWWTLFLLNPIVNWVIPFLILLSRPTKRNPKVLLAVAILLLGGRWLDLYLQVMPALDRGPGPGPGELLVFAGCGGLFVYLALRALTQAPLVARWNPLLEESLHYHST